jgi:isorenieratene synthase
MERGFHAFFRHYYNLRGLLRRVDPSLGMLAPLADYPIMTPERTLSFTGLSRHPLIGILQLVRRTTMRLRDLARVDVRAAVAMLRFDGATTYARFDRRTAKAYLDDLRFPLAVRRLLFDVFAHSFFNPEAEMSAAELLMMFHFYFFANPEGLVFDVARRPFSAALWQPLSRHLEARGAELALGEQVARIAPGAGGFAIETRSGGRVRARLVGAGSPAAGRGLPRARFAGVARSDRAARGHAAVRRVADLARRPDRTRARAVRRHDGDGPARQHLPLSPLRGRESRVGGAHRRRGRRAPRLCDPDRRR